MSRTAQDTELFTLLTANRGWIIKNPLPVHQCDTLSEALEFAKESILKKRKSPLILSRDDHPDCSTANCQACQRFRFLEQIELIC
jgi:hypothetical protein